jgi:hypothetical protein
MLDLLEEETQDLQVEEKHSHQQGEK